MTLNALLNVCYVLMLDEWQATVRAERQALMIAAVMGSKAEIPDIDHAQRSLDEQLAAPLPTVDPTTHDLRQALGLSA